jgi:type I restriction enzyme S subunit
MTFESEFNLELGEIIKTISPPKKIQTSEFLEKGDYPIVDQSPPKVAGWTNDETALVHPPKDGLIVFGDHTCILKFEKNSFAQGADGIKIIEVKKGINPHYVYAHLKAFPLLNDGYKRHFSELKRLKIRIPDLRIQDYISEIHYSIDLKIDSNIDVAKTLEDIAQILFKSWFLDFDPVKAKMSGEKPAGIDSTTAALFPDSMEESELGLIPKGWEVRKIESLCETQLGGTPSRSRDEFWGGDISWINSGKVNDFRINVASEYITELGLEKSATKLLPKGTTVLAITGATLGQFSRLEIDSCANQSVVGILGSAEASNEFVYLNIKNGIQRLISAQTGGAQQHINKEDVNAFLVVYPGKKLMKTFTDVVGDIFAEIGVLLNQSISLAEIRESLMPRLISGELQIPEEMLAS